MYYCYIDESGNSEVINNPSDNKQPLLVLCGLIVDANKIHTLTQEFINLKRRFFPSIYNSVKHDLDALQLEIKGSDLRTDIRKLKITDKVIEHHFKFLDGIFSLIKKYNVQLISRIWVKDFGVVLTDKSIYTKSTQEFCRRFQMHLTEKKCTGSIIADFRDPHRNSYVSHSVFTQKYKQSGDAYSSIIEIPTFGISNSHACLQIADILCSTVITPIAGRKFCKTIINNPHTHKNYDWISKRYSKRLKAIQYNCSVGGKKYYGITAFNPHDKTNVNLFS